MGVECAFVECPNAGGSRLTHLKVAAVFMAAALALVLALGFASAPAFADEGAVGADVATCNFADSCALSSEGLTSADSASLLAPSASVQVPNLTLYGLDGTVRTLEYHYNGSPYVVLCGRPGCGNTRTMVSDMMSAQENGYEDVGLIVLDCDDDPSTFSSGFGSLHSNDAYFASASNANYSSWSWSLLRKVDPSAPSSISLPFAFIIDEDGVVQWASTGVFDVYDALETALAGGGSDPAPTPNPAVKLDLLVEVSVDQAEARKVLALVNEARSAVGQPALKWDETLEETALQRAAELVVLFEHKRPDGSDCFAIFPPFRTAGENIAFGYRTAEAVNDGWTNSPGHYANMIKAGYKSMAVACVKIGNLYYWAELFTDRAGSTTLGEPLVGGSEEFVVTKLSRDFSLSLDDPGELSVGDEVDFVDMVLVDDEFPLANGDDLAWESDDPSVLRIGADGKAVALAPGSAQVTVSLAASPSVSDSVTITVTGEAQPVTYDVKVSALPAEGGVVLGGGAYEEGEEAVVRAVAYEGFEFVGWMEGDTCVSTKAIYTFEVYSDRELVAVFEAVEPEPGPGPEPDPEPDPDPDPDPDPEPAFFAVSLLASPVEGGIVVGGGTFEEGKSITVAAVPSDGYEFVGWFEDGVLVSDFAAYSFAVSENRSLTAVFEIAGSEPDPDPDPDPGPNPPYSDLWRSFPDVMKEVEKAGGPSKVWYVADGWLDYVVDAGLMGGYSSNGWFGAYDNITRGQVAVILYRAECAKDPSLLARYGSTTDPAKYAWLCAFRDMDASVYYTAAVNWAKDAGILTGDAATNYTTVRPDDPVARQELCLMLARYANGGEVPPTQLDPAKAQGIKGMSAIASWARDGVYWAVNNGVIGGVSNGDGTFSMNPAGKTWRSAAAKMFAVVMRDVM